MKKQVNVEGMSCMHCVKHVEEALKELKGVKAVSVNLGGKNAIIETDGEVEDVRIKEAVEEAGYDVTGIKNI
ncbi:MAG: heavy-metal-associated domain-containing protein [Caulobacteraceae bacterium]